MKRTLIFIYGVISYAIFFVTFLYAIGFIGNILVPKAIDSAQQIPLTQALLINLGLLGIFALQHSLMARPFFKRWLTRYIPQTAERSTYVLISSLLLIALFWFWEPMGGVVWNVENEAGRILLHAAFAFGWTLVLVSTFLINHFDLFGLRQVWLNLKNRPYTEIEFKMPSIYRVVRHPLYLGWLFAFWATPTMTIAHLVFAVATTAYILIAIQFEERDLVRMHPEYANYRKTIPMIIPFLGRKKSTQASPGAPAGVA